MDTKQKNLADIESELIEARYQLELLSLNPLTFFGIDIDNEKESKIEFANEFLVRPGQKLYELYISTAQLKDAEIELKRKIASLEKQKLQYLHTSNYQDVTSKFTITYSKHIYRKSEAVLNLAEKIIELPKDRNEAYLCEVLFSNERNMKKEWLSIDVIEASKERILARSKNPKYEKWRPIYHAAKKLNERIMLAIGIKDFFVTKPVTTLKINSKYLQ